MLLKAMQVFLLFNNVILARDLIHGTSKLSLIKILSEVVPLVK
jgi:hypothetical protein